MRRQSRLPGWQRSGRAGARPSPQHPSILGAQHHLRSNPALPQAVKKQQPRFAGGDTRHSILQGPIRRRQGAFNLREGARPCTLRSHPPSLRRGANSRCSAGFLPRGSADINPLPSSSHQTVLAAHLPPTPRNPPDSLHPRWGGSKGGCAGERGAPRVSGLCQARARARMTGRAGGRDGKGPRFGQMAAPRRALCCVLLSHPVCRNNPASKAGSTGSNLGFLHINGIKATV